MAGGVKRKQSKEFLKLAHDRFEQCVQAEHKLRERWLDDLRFENGEQWPEAIRRIREKDPANPRPCLTINKVQTHCRQVINDIRQNRPQIKVLPVDGMADPETADILSGHIRNIEAVSDADVAWDFAVTPQVKAGIGYVRILTKVIDARLNLQDIEFKPVLNPLAVYLDPAREHPAGQDCRFGFVVEDLTEDRFKEQYPDAKTVSFRDKGRGDTTANWYPDKQMIRVAEYYWLERKLETFLEDAQGNVYDDEGLARVLAADPTVQIVQVRRQYVDCCYWAKITGAEVLEETEVPCPYIPIIRVAGLEGIIDGETYVKGLVRDAMDPQRIYNYWVTLNTETIALSPKSPYIAAQEAIEDYQNEWQRANVDNVSVLPYKHVDDNGNVIPAPQRASPPQQSTALVQAIVQADQDLMSVMGRFEASIGDQSNEKSGRAIIARQRQGDNATFHFSDNLGRALRYAGRILLAMIPKVYDTKRMLRLLGEDGTTEFAEIDPSLPRARSESTDMAGKVRKVYNLSAGRYDVTVLAGPSYATKRQEAAEMMTQLAQADPTLMQKAGDIIVKGYDLPLADDLAKRLKLYQPPEVQQAESEDENDPQAMVAQAVQASRQQLMAEIQPAIQEMQTALQEAEADAQAKEQQIAQLKMQLANKEAEIELKREEMAMRAEEARAKQQAEADKGETEIVRMVLERALTPEPEPVEEKDDGEESEALKALVEQLSKPKRKTIKIVTDDAGMPVGAEVVEE